MASKGAEVEPDLDPWRVRLDSRAPGKPTNVIEIWRTNEPLEPEATGESLRPRGGCNRSLGVSYCRSANHNHDSSSKTCPGKEDAACSRSEDNCSGACCKDVHFCAGSQGNDANHRSDPDAI